MYLRGGLNVPMELFPVTAVVLAKSPSGSDASGQAILLPPVQSTVQWTQRKQEVIAITQYPVPRGSQMWVGTLADYQLALSQLQAGQNLDMWVVLENSVAYDAKGRNARYRSDLIPATSSGTT